jgi:acetoin utilization protein AcuC
MTQPLTIAYSDDYLNWQLGSGNGSHPTKPIRAKIATELLIEELGFDQIDIINPEVELEKDLAHLSTIHTEKHITDVINGDSGEWYGTNTKLGYTALQMFSGTARLVEQIIAGDIKVGFNPQGAKHHAQAGWSEGFCVFNDHAWAALEFKKAGLRPLYIDWDVNAGDGVQNLLADTDIPTFSIHGHGIYPLHSDTYNAEEDGKEPYEYHNPSQHWYNYALPQGSGDEEFAWAIDRIAEKVAEYQPDVILLATGADAHEHDNWGLKYTYAGYRYASSVVAELANKYSQGRVLIGGAGGYKAYSSTPRVWAEVVKTIYLNTKDVETN